MSFNDPAFDDWIDRGRGVTVRAELERRGIWTRKMLGDAGNPCPGCGGHDRFAVNLRKNKFNCRHAGVGGDAIALVRHVDDVTFLQAVEILTGEAPPSGEKTESAEARAARVVRLEARDRAKAEIARKQQIEGEHFRSMERRAAFDIWCAGTAIRDTPAAEYLAARGLRVPVEARLRFHRNLPYFVQSQEHKGRALFSGPALLAAIGNADGAIIGVHRTWIDADRPGRKREIFDPDTGELLGAKKARGSVRGGLIKLAGFPFDRATPVAGSRLVMGEGIETTLSVYTAMPEAERTGMLFAAGVSLGNMCGKAAGRVAHPTLTKLVAGKGGKRADRQRRLFVPDAVPAPNDDSPLIGLPDSVSELLLLGDGDSDAFTTKLALQRAAVRFADAYPGVTVRCAMAHDGLDFNDMLREAA